MLVAYNLFERLGTMTYTVHVFVSSLNVWFIIILCLYLIPVIPLLSLFLWVMICHKDMRKNDLKIFSLFSFSIYCWY